MLFLYTAIILKTTLHVCSDPVFLANLFGIYILYIRVRTPYCHCRNNSPLKTTPLVITIQLGPSDGGQGFAGVLTS